MSIARRLANGLELRSAPLSGITSPSGDLESALLGGMPTHVGKSVTPESALRVASVYTAIRILSEAVRICPLEVQRPAAELTRYVSAPDNRLWPIMNVAPNPEIPASELWEIVTGQLAIHGNAFIFKERDGSGRVVRLWPLQPAQVMVGRLERQKVYALYPWTVAGMPPYDLPPIGTARDIIHFRWFGVNGLVGLSPVRQLQEEIGIEDAQGEFTARTMVNNAIPGGLLTTEGEISKEAADRLLARWKTAHEGLANAAKVAVLEGGMKWQPTAMTLVDAEFIKQRQLSIQTIARGWRIPASMFLAESGSSMRYTTTEQEGRNFIAYTLAPILDRIAAPLIADPDLQIEPGLRFSFDTDSILNVQTLDRIRATTSLVLAGVMSRNDGRAKEGLAPVDGLDTFANPDIKARLTGALEAQEIQELLLNAVGSNGNGGGVNPNESVN